jgi:transposase
MRCLNKGLSNHAACKLQARFQLHREKLLVFLYCPEVPPTNNQSEQALRSSVILRKVVNGFRSEWGLRPTQHFNPSSQRLNSKAKHL